MNRNQEVWELEWGGGGSITALFATYLDVNVNSLIMSVGNHHSNVSRTYDFVSTEITRAYVSAHG